MTFSTLVGPLRVLILGCLCLGLTGCPRLFESGSEDEWNSVIAEALSKKAAYNFKGAIASLEKALEANPKLARAHWELGLICYENVNDYAAAIYHFQKLLELKPDWKQADSAKRFIEVCKIELAKTAPLGPQTPQVQRVIDSLTARQLELTRENTQLKESLQAWQTRVQQLAVESAQLKLQLQARGPSNLALTPSVSPGLTNSSVRGVPTAAAPSVPASSQPSNAPAAAIGPRPSVAAKPSASAPPTTISTASPAPSPAAPTAAKTYRVKAGDTAMAIARLHRLALGQLLAANPGLDPHRLRVGQVLRLPGP